MNTALHAELPEPALPPAPIAGNDIADIDLVHGISVALIGEHDVAELYGMIVDAAVAITGSQFGTMQRVSQRMPARHWRSSTWTTRRSTSSSPMSSCPRIDGVELGRHIHASWPGINVVLTSGYSHVLATDARHGFTLLHKPYLVAELSAALNGARQKR